MLPDRRMPEDEVCPVRDELLGELYCAAEHGVSTWLQALRRISGRSSPSTAIAAVICTRGEWPLQQAVTKTIWCGGEDT